jgi:hypothetical protein
MTRLSPGRKKKQKRVCIIIRSKYRYNNYQKIKTLNRVYKMLDILCRGCFISAGKFIKLTTKFYTFILVDYKSITDFSS